MAKNEFSFPVKAPKRQRPDGGGAFPGLVDITLTIRPSSQDFVFSLLPVALAAVMALFFSVGPSCALGADVKSCFLRKSHGFNEFNAGAPVERTSTPFGFWVDAYTDSSNLVITAEVRLPDGSSRPLVWLSRDYGKSGYSFADNFTNAESLDAGYSDGTYTLILTNLNDGPKSIPLHLLPDTYPNTP